MSLVARERLERALLTSDSLGLPKTAPRAFAAAIAAFVRSEIRERSFSARAAYR